MTIYQQRIVRFAAGMADAGTAAIAGAGSERIRSHGGRLFGVFRPVIGLSTNCAIVITAAPSQQLAETAAAAGLADVRGWTELSLEVWEPTTRPLPDGRPTEKGGVYSHRAFDILEGDWPRFRALSEAAWGNWEGAHAARVAGFWKSQTPPADGQLRVRLMAWYENLDAWERSRWWNPEARAGSDEAFARFRERSRMLQDTSVSILSRVPLIGEA